MANVFVNETYLEDIADSIRAKLGVQTTYKPSQMADAIDSISGGITPTGTVSITQNGTTDVTNYASASVSVPNSYSASDEGKVVSNGALVSQTSDTVTTNDTYDTTLINSLTVNVSGGGGGVVSLLETVTVAENTRSFNIDLSDYQDCNLLYIYADIELTASDWLYYVKNGSAASGGTYNNQLLTHNFVIAIQIQPAGASTNVFAGALDSGHMNLTTGAMNNLFIYTYNANTRIKAGSTLKVYGGYYADM